MGRTDRLRALRGRTAIVTGASSGIGAALARRLAAEGLPVVLVARRQVPLSDLAEEIEAHGGRAEVLVADLRQAEGRRRVGEVLDRASTGLLVNDAGVAVHGSLVDVSLESALEMVAVNAAVVVELTKRAVDAFVPRRGGAIINVASTAAFKPMPGLSVYGSTKAFVRTLSRSVGVEVARHGVDICVVHPGPVRTPMLESALGRPMAPSGAFGRLIERTWFMDVDVCARRALEGFRRGRSEVVVDHFDRMLVRLPLPVIERIDNWSLHLLTGG